MQWHQACRDPFVVYLPCLSLFIYLLGLFAHFSILSLSHFFFINSFNRNH